MSDFKIEKKDTPTSDEYLNLYELGVLDLLPPEVLTLTKDDESEK